MALVYTTLNKYRRDMRVSSRAGHTWAGTLKEQSYGMIADRDPDRAGEPGQIERIAYTRADRPASRPTVGLAASHAGGAHARAGVAFPAGAAAALAQPGGGAGAARGCGRMGRSQLPQRRQRHRAELERGLPLDHRAGRAG